MSSLNPFTRQLVRLGRSSKPQGSNVESILSGEVGYMANPRVCFCNSTVIVLYSWVDMLRPSMNKFWSLDLRLAHLSHPMYLSALFVSLQNKLEKAKRTKWLPFRIPREFRRIKCSMLQLRLHQLWSLRSQF